MSTRRQSQPPGPDGLGLDLACRTGVMALRLSGELDLASAPRFRRAVDWLRRRHDQAIILDTTGLTFIDLPGYRALNAALVLPDGRRDPRVLYVVGAAVARLGAFLDQAGRAGRAERRHPPLPPGGPPIDVPA